jgi:6-phosphogluconate dehydrogenase
MRIGMIGLGRMGGSMTERLLAHNHEVVVFDTDPSRVAAATTDGAIGASSLTDLIAALAPPRTVWVMLPAGTATNDTIAAISAELSAGDVLVDGGNSHYCDARRWSAQLDPRDIAFVDVGVSGGLPGRAHGYCLMIGGDPAPVAQLSPILTALAAPGGHAHVGPSGAGHYAKMIHNGIEYGLLEAYAEGFALLDAAPELIADPRQLASLWNRGSVVRSWLLELAEAALDDPGRFAGVDGRLADSGEDGGRSRSPRDEESPRPSSQLPCTRGTRRGGSTRSASGSSPHCGTSSEVIPPSSAKTSRPRRDLRSRSPESDPERGIRATAARQRRDRRVARLARRRGPGGGTDARAARRP